MTLCSLIVLGLVAAEAVTLAVISRQEKRIQGLEKSQKGASRSGKLRAR